MASVVVNAINNDTGGNGTLDLYGGVSSYNFYVYGKL